MRTKDHKIRQKKAMRVAALVGLGGLIPISFLIYFYLTNVKVDATGMGVVPDFFYTFVNDPVGITHHDTEQYPMLIAILRDHCQDSSSEICTQSIRFLDQIKNWADQSIKVRQENVSNPRSIRLIVMIEGDYQMIPPGWDIISMTPETPYLIPANKLEETDPAIVLIDDSSFFRGFIPMSFPQAFEKVSREVTRIVSQQYLMHYVTQQTLMWEKARGRKSSTSTDTQPEAH